MSFKYKKTKLLLIRHADTDENWSGEYQEPPGPPLSKIGRKKILSIKNKLLNEFYPDNIYVSPFKRTLESFELLINRKKNIIIEERLSERRPNESFENVKERVSEWINENIKYNGKTIWVCSHCAPINVIVLILTPFKFETAMKDERGCVVPKGGVWLIEWEDEKITKSELIIGKEYFKEE